MPSAVKYPRGSGRRITTLPAPTKEKRDSKRPASLPSLRHYCPACGNCRAREAGGLCDQCREKGETPCP